MNMVQQLISVMQAAPARRLAVSRRPVPPFVAGSLTVSNLAIGNIYDGRYNRSRLIKPAYAAQDTFALWCGDQGDDMHAWLPISNNPSFSRTPASVQHETTEAMLCAALAQDSDYRRQWIAVGKMDSPVGWKSSTSAGYLSDQMS